MPPRVSHLGATSCAALLAMSAAGFAGPVDETALREYVRQQRPDRVELETRRLERLHPDWKPPADLWTARPSGPDEAPLWELFERNDLVGLRKAIAQRQSEEPGWRPSGDLTDKIKTRELRAALFARGAAGRWAEAAKLADDNGLSGGTSDIELLWIVAEALARTERSKEASALYQFVLTNRTVPAERIATVQKALATLSMAEAEKLIAMGKVGPDGRSEFDAIRLDITRARISAILRNDPGNAVQPADVAALEDVARPSAAGAGDARLLAWYDYRLGRFDAALEWFKTSLAREGDAMTAHGLALTMLKLGMRRDAEDVAYTWREQLSNNMILFIDILETDLTKEIPPYIEPARLARYAQVATKTQSGEGAQGLGWYAYNSCQFETAHEWFARAVAWFPKEATLYGYGLTLQRLKKRHELVELVNRYDGLFPRVVGLVFRDDYIHPPTPCEVKAHPQLASRTAAPYWQPTKFKLSAADPYAGHRIARTDFPVAVPPENPLRYALRGGTLLDRTSQFGQPYRVEEPFKPPLKARRVPGAEAMPYERFGLSLLPGYNGETTLSFHAGAYRTAAKGTVWAEENSGAGRDTPQAATPPQPSTAPQASLASPPVRLRAPTP